MKTFLVAVVAPSHQDVEHFLKASPYSPGGFEQDSAIDSWWVAEDDREDGSDCDSAVFVPRGSQRDMSDMIKDHIEHHTEEWDEIGYPYANTDVSGFWYQDPEARRRMYELDHPTPEVSVEDAVQRAAIAFLKGEDWSSDAREQLARLLNLCDECDEPMWNNLCHSTKTSCSDCCFAAFRGGCCG